MRNTGHDIATALSIATLAVMILGILVLIYILGLSI